MDHVLLAAVVALVVPIGLFLGMMATAALALLANGEDPRAALAMPRTICRHAVPARDKTRPHTGVALLPGVATEGRPRATAVSGRAGVAPPPRGHRPVSDAPGHAEAFARPTASQHQPWLRSWAGPTDDFVSSPVDDA